MKSLKVQELRKKYFCVDVSGAARILKIDQGSVYRILINGRLKGIKKGGRWVIPNTYVLKYKEKMEKRKRNRPPEKEVN